MRLNDVRADVHVHAGSRPAWRSAYSRAHQRDAARAAAEDGLSAQGLEGEVLVRLAADDEGAVAGGQLADDLGVVRAALVVDVDGALPGPSGRVRLAREQRGHGLVGARRRWSARPQALVREVALFHGDVLGGVEHRMGHLG